MEILTVLGVAELLKVSRKTIYYWISRDEIPYFKVGKHRRFDRDEVMEYFRQATEESKPPCFQKLDLGFRGRSVTTRKEDIADTQEE